MGLLLLLLILLVFVGGSFVISVALLKGILIVCAVAFLCNYCVRGGRWY